jgi:hypothetical protein
MEFFFDKLSNPVYMFTYDTVVEAVKGLKERGYTIDFNLEADKICCTETSLALKPADFEITEFHRFEGNSDPADEAAVYAIESKDGKKGLLVTGFGITAEGIGEEMIEKLTVRH